MSNNITEEVIKIKEKYFVSQTSINDCGVACLNMMFKLNGIKVDEEKIKNEFVVEDVGVNAYDIIKVAKKYGLLLAGYKNYELKNSKVPFIALTINDNNTQHFVIVLKVLKDMVLIADPACNIMYVKKEEFKSKYTKVALLKENDKFKLFSFAKNKKLICLIVTTTLLVAFLSVFTSYVLSYIIKLLESNKSISMVIGLVIIFLLVGILKEVFNYIKQLLSLKFRLLIDKAITIPTIKKLINLPHEFYQMCGSGELISKVNDLSYVKEMFFKAVEVLFVNIVLIIISIFVNSYFIPFLFFINIFLIAIYYFINKRYLKKHFYETYDLQIKNERLSNELTDVFGGILTVKNLSLENYFFDKISSSYNNLLKKINKISISHQKKNLLLSLMIVLFNSIIMGILVVNKVSIYRIMFVLSIEGILFDCLNNIFSLSLLYADFKSAHKRIKVILNKIPMVKSNLKLNINSIDFKNLSYKYKDTYVLKNINFSIKKGQFIMVNGPSGSGKTTLFKLLSKQLNTDDLNIYVNDKKISLYDDGVIENNITYVDQRVRLFNKSIKENIFFDKKYDSNVLKITMVDKLLKEIGIDINYVVDNTNSNLSGGQIQKIMIASALMQNKEVIIFDETTSQLDKYCERIILKNIRKNYPLKTIILISHKMVNKDLFDKVITLDDGFLKKSKKGYENEVKKRRIKTN